MKKFFCQKSPKIGPFLLFALLVACNRAPRNTLFTALSPAQTGVEFVNALPEQSPAGMNIVQYLYYYNGGGVAAGDVDKDGLCDLFFTSNLGPNQLYRNKGDFQFENISEKSGISGNGSWKTGCSMADVNGDGWLDIYVCQVGQYKQFSGRNQLFVNNQDGTFTERAADFGLDFRGFATQAAFFDFDLDGDLDCFLLCHSVHSPESYRDTSISRQFDALASDRFFKNENGRFVDITPRSGLRDGKSGYGLGLAVADVNADGYPDIYVANDFHENDFLYYNLRGTGFREGIAASTGHTSNFSMGCDMADFNNDARPDIVSLDMKPEDEVTLKASAPADPYQVYNFKHRYGYHWQFARNNLQLNGGKLGLEGGGLTVAGKGSKAPSLQPPASAFFSEIGQLAGVATTDWSWSALFADLDGDGWKDLFVTNGIPHRPNDSDYNKFTSSKEVQAQATDLQLIEKMPSGRAANYAFRNRGDLRFDNVAQAWGLDHAGFSNGAVYADLDNDGDLDLATNNLNEPASIFKNNSTGRHFLKIKFSGAGKNPFGLGARVFLRAGGQLQYFENQVVRGFQSSVEPGLSIGLGAAQMLDSLLVQWPDGRSQVLKNLPADQTLTLKQSESEAIERDFFSPARLKIFLPGDWTDSLSMQIFNDLAREKLLPWNIAAPKTAPPPVPDVRENIACLRPCDFDGDGDEDLFVGARSVSGAYGIAPNSCLLRNEGAGRYTDSKRLKNIGLVTDAIWADVDGDRRPDLLVAGEWMPLTIFKNRGGAAAFEKTEIEHSAGLWNCLSAGDFDGDGDLDFVAGNLGLNSNLQASPAEPLGLWVKDFDRNGDFDPILTYFRQGKNYVFADKDLLVSQLPGLKKQFVQYRKYAESTFEEVFPANLRKDAVYRQAETLATSWVENRGEGQFVLHPLPTAAQFSPVFAALSADFDGDGHLDVLLGGNFHEVSPAIGRFDASAGKLLRGDGKGGFFDVEASESGFQVLGAVRSLMLKNDADGQKFVEVGIQGGRGRRFFLPKKDQTPKPRPAK